MIGVYTLPELGGLIERSTGIKAQVCMVQNGDVLNGKKQAEQIRLLSKIMAEETMLEEINFWNVLSVNYQVFLLLCRCSLFLRCLFLFVRKITNMDFWICTIYSIKWWQTATIRELLLLLLTLFFCRGSVPAFPVYEKAGGTAASTADGCHEPHPEWEETKGVPRSYAVSRNLPRCVRHWKRWYGSWRNRRISPMKRS